MSESIHTLTFDEFAFANYNDKTKNDHTSTEIDLSNQNSRMLCKFASAKNVGWGFNRIKKIRAGIYIKELTAISASGPVIINTGTEDSLFSATTVTYATKPAETAPFGRGYVQAQGQAYAELSISGTYGERNVFTNGIGLAAQMASVCNAYTPASANKPKLEITVDDNDLVRVEAYYWDSTYGGKTITKSSGADVTIDGILTRQNGLCYSEVAQSGISGVWRANENSEEHEIPMADRQGQSLVFPLGTFGALTQVQVRPKITSSNTLTWTPDTWLTINLEDAIPQAIPVSPVGESVDKNSQTVFRWSHVISTGSAQTKAELQKSTDGTTWTALATVTGAENSYTAPAGTFNLGVNFWRVRTYNADNVAGEWSGAAQFICIGAPDAPIVTVAGTHPRPVATWQANGQLAYQVEIDGVYSSGTYYGTDKTWTAPMYLADGEHIVRVRVQNEYAMWSPWGSAALQVANTAGPAINLMAEAGDTVRLFWSAAGGYHYNFYLIYRNGKLIAKTTEHTCTDLRSIGSVSYQVRGCFAASSNYRLSNTMTVTASVPCVTLIDLDTGDVLPLPYSASTHRTTGRNLSRGVQSVQLAGRRYPTIERSMHYAETISVACAFREAEDCAALEALVGKMVAVKTPESKMVSGCLSVLAATADGGFYTTYQFDVEQADVEEVVDIDS